MEYGRIPAEYDETSLFLKEAKLGGGTRYAAVFSFHGNIWSRGRIR